VNSVDFPVPRRLIVAELAKLLISLDFLKNRKVSKINDLAEFRRLWIG